MAWANRHLVGLLFGLALLILVGSIFLSRGGPRELVAASAFIFVIAAIIIRAKRRPLSAPPAPPPDRADPA